MLQTSKTYWHPIVSLCTTMCIIICVECDYIITSRHSIFNYDTLLLSCIEQQVPRNIYDILKGTSLK